MAGIGFNAGAIGRLPTIGTFTSTTTFVPVRTGNLIYKLPISLLGSGSGGNSGNATATAGAATVTAPGALGGKVTTEALVTAADATYTLTLTNAMIAAADVVFFTPARGTATTGTLVPISVVPGVGNVIAVFQNTTTSPLNGTMVLGYRVHKA